MRKLMVALLSFFLSALACAQTEKVGEAIYFRYNFLQEEGTVGTWTFSYSKSTKTMEIEKNMDGAEKETMNLTMWERSTLHPDQGIILKESLAVPLEWMRNFESGFGHIAVVDMITGDTLQVWPMSYKMTSYGFVTRVEFKAYRSQGGTYIITREFFKDGYYVPIRERRQVIQADGTVTADVIDHR